MTIKSDRWIRSQCIHPSRIALPNYGCEGEDYSDIATPVGDSDIYMKPMITPFAPQAVRSRKRWQPQDGECVAMVPQYDLRNGGIVTEDKVVSYGVSSFGYDIRAANEWKVFTNINNTLVDPKAFDERCFQTIVGDSVIIPPNSFALARTVEYFRIPRDVLTICLGKSTYARCGIIVNVTPLEPEWEGHLVLEFSNTTPLPAKLYANEGVAQLLFLQSDEPCEVSYADRGGKYQGQTGVTLPRM